MSPKFPHPERISALVAVAVFPFLTILPVTGLSNDFPTEERVSYVMGCMEENGGQNVQNLYTCSCRLDSLASDMTFVAYDQAITYEAFRRMPGEKGGVYRDSKEADKAVDMLGKARTKAEKSCPIIRHIGARPPEEKS